MTLTYPRHPPIFESERFDLDFHRLIFLISFRTDCKTLSGVKKIACSLDGVITVDEAKKIGLKTLGHIPEAFEGNTERAFVPNFAMVVHAEEFAKQATRKTDACFASP